MIILKNVKAFTLVRLPHFLPERSFLWDGVGEEGAG